MNNEIAELLTLNDKIEELKQKIQIDSKKLADYSARQRELLDKQHEKILNDIRNGKLLLVNAETGEEVSIRKF